MIFSYSDIKITFKILGKKIINLIYIKLKLNL